MHCLSTARKEVSGGQCLVFYFARRFLLELDLKPMNAGQILPSQCQCRRSEDQLQTRIDCDTTRQLKQPTRRLIVEPLNRPQAGQRPVGHLKRDGGARRSRTDDILLAKQALYQLSYGPKAWEASQMIMRRAGRPGQTRTADLTLIRRTL